MESSLVDERGRHRHQSFAHSLSRSFVQSAPFDPSCRRLFFFCAQLTAARHSPSSHARQLEDKQQQPQRLSHQRAVSDERRAARDARRLQKYFLDVAAVATTATTSARALRLSYFVLFATAHLIEEKYFAADAHAHPTARRRSPSSDRINAHVPAVIIFELLSCIPSARCLFVHRSCVVCCRR